MTVPGEPFDLGPAGTSARRRHDAGGDRMTSPRRARGELEAQVMRVLWESDDGIAARQVQQRIPGSAPAHTTVLTALDRLVAKGHAHRSDHQRGILFAAVRSEEEHVSAAMLDRLHDSSNREAALLHFVGTLDEQDAELLRRSLDRRD